MNREKFLEEMDHIVEVSGSNVVKNVKAAEYGSVISYKIANVEFSLFENDTLNLCENKMIVFIDLKDIENFHTWVNPRSISIFLRFIDDKNNINIKNLKII